MERCAKASLVLFLCRIKRHRTRPHALPIDETRNFRLPKLSLARTRRPDAPDRGGGRARTARPERLARPRRARASGARSRIGRRLRADMAARRGRSEEHTSELQSLMRSSYAVFCLKKKTKRHTYHK